MLFSIITPSFNQLQWLRLCVASVRDQTHATVNVSVSSKIDSFSLNKGFPEEHTSHHTYSNEVAIVSGVEHIIQDAGTQGIENFAREVGAEFYKNGILVSDHSGSVEPKFCSYRIAIYSEEDYGMYDAINRGIARSKGEICAWLNSDEQYLEYTIAKVAKMFAADPGWDVILGDALLVNSRMKPICYRRIMIPNRWHTRLAHLHSLSCAMFFRRSAVSNPALDPTWKVIGDAVLMDYFLGSGKKIHACQELLSAYAFTGSNLSANANHGEHARWLSISIWPPLIVRPFLVLHNRLRRMLHGAYRSFDVQTALYTPESGECRKATNARLSGRWPRTIE